MDDLTGEFVTETREMLERISDALIAWETQPDDVSRLDEVFRFVHTVKGSCGFLDLPRIGALAHAAETTLAAVRRGDRLSDPAFVSAMLAVVDRIAVLVEALSGGEDDTTLPEISTDEPLIARLEAAGPAPVAAVHDAPRTISEPVSVQAARSVRVGVPLLEALMMQVSELVLVRNDLARRIRDSDRVKELQVSFDRLSSIVGELRDSVTRTRMQPIEKLFSVLPRVVRDTAAECGKLVTVELGGQDVEIDREMVEAIRDPLIHIVRNAIDHGIETPEERIAAGKPASGVIRVVAIQSGNQVSIEIDDDGRGIDVQRLLSKAVQAEIIGAGHAATVDPDAALQLIFEPGLSTARTVSHISGRGVGMDIVRANVERLGGTVVLGNRPGEGLTITLRAPLTLSIVTALVVRAGGQAFAIPRSAIEEVVSLGSHTARIEKVGSDLLAVLRGSPMRAFSLAEIMGLSAELPSLAVVIATPSGQRYALAIDSIDDQEELVVRPMAPLLANTGLFSGHSLSNDGQPIVVLDPVGIALRLGLDRRRNAPAADAMPAAVDERSTVLLATGLDGEGIAIRSAFVDRVIHVDMASWAQSYDEHFVIIDDAHVPVRWIGQLPDSGRVTMVMLNDGARALAFPVRAVQDLSPMSEITPLDDPRTEGLIRVDETSYTLLDGFWLFGDLPAAGQPRGKAVAMIDAPRTPWTQALLAPLLERAGYHVSFGADAEAPDLIVRIGGSEHEVAAGTPVLTLDQHADGGIATERYDRATLAKRIAEVRRKAA